MRTIHRGCQGCEHHKRRWGRVLCSLGLVRYESIKPLMEIMHRRGASVVCEKDPHKKRALKKLVEVYGGQNER